MCMTRYLKNHSYDIVGLDCNFYKGFFSHIDETYKPTKQIIKDIRLTDETDLEGIDAVIHLAALSNDPLGAMDPKITLDINFQGTVHLAQLCKKLKIQRFLFSSSCSMYGISHNETPINEEAQLNPLTAYAQSKVLSEDTLKAMVDDNFHPVFLRNATVYGASPKLRLDLVVNNLVAHALLTNSIQIQSDGTPWRPLIHVEDLCRAFECVLEAHLKDVHAQAFNVGVMGENYRVSRIAQLVQHFLPSSHIEILNKTGGDERSYQVNFSKFKNNFPHFSPSWNVEKSIQDLIVSYKKNSLTKEDFLGGRYFRITQINNLIKSGKLNELFYWQ